MEVGDAVAPLHEGTSATIRATSLSGITSRYISLKPGPNNARELEDGDSIGSDETSAPVDLDTLFNTLDAKTRAGLRNFIRGSGTQYEARGAEAGQSIQYFAPFLGSTSRLTQELALDQQVFEQFVQDGADTVSAIASRRGDLTELVSNTNAAMRAIGDENVALQRALELLPGTLRKANTTFVNLRNTLDDLDKLVEESKPNTKELAPFFRALRPLVHDARPTVADLRDLIRSPGPNNDLIELTAKQPRLAELTAQRVPARDPDARPLRPRDLVRPPLHPGPVGMAHGIRPGGGLLRRQRPLRARPAGVRPHGPRPRPVQADRRLPVRSPELVRTGTAAPTARAAPPSPRPTARRPGS